MKVYNILTILIIVSVLFTIQSSAYLTIGKQSQCVNIKVLSNCTNVNLTEVGNNNYSYIINSAMTKTGQTFNYSFCNTNYLGIYTYSWNDYCTDCSQGDCGNNFKITPNGYELQTSDAIFYSIILIFLIFSFIYILSKSIQSETLGVQIGLSTLSYLILLITVFIAYNVSVNYLYDLPFISNILNVSWIVLALGTFVVFLLAIFGILLSQARSLSEQRKHRFDDAR